MNKNFLVRSLLLVVMIVFSGYSLAAKPVRNQEPAAPPPEVFSVKVDYQNGFIVVEGDNLDPGTVSGTIAGVTMIADGASTTNSLFFSFSSEISSAVDELGNYVVNIVTAGGTVTLTAFIPFALVANEPPPPPGPDCPCSPEWDQKSAATSPLGFSGQTPYCSQDLSNFTTVQFYDQPANNYWVLWTEWTGSSGYCELYIDGPERQLSSEAQFTACATYLRNIVTVWGDQGNDCLF